MCFFIYLNFFDYLSGVNYQLHFCDVAEKLLILQTKIKSTTYDQYRPAIRPRNGNLQGNI